MEEAALIRAAKEARDRVAAEMPDGDDKVSALSCADEDVDDADVVYDFESTWYCPYEEEKPLCLLLGMLYFARIPREDWLDRVASPREHLDCLLDFTAALEAASFDDYNHKQDADDAIEELWHKHCASRGYRVSFQEKPWKTDYEEPKRPLRDPDHPLAFDSATYRPREFASELVKSEPDCGRDIPAFFTIASKVMESDCFIALPSRLHGNARPKLLTFLSDRHPVYEELSNLVEAIYRDVEGCRLPHFGNDEEKEEEWEEEEEEDEELVHRVTVEEVKKILRAVEGNRLCRSLFVERPPRSILPHALAVKICTEHARLWLARMDLRIYYNLKLKYAELCTQEAREAEEEAREQGFQLEGRPSSVESFLRAATLDLIWSSSERVVIFEAEDYELVPASASKCVRKVGFPVCATKWGEIEERFLKHIGLPPVVMYEERSKRDWLLAKHIPAATKKKKSFNQMLATKPWAKPWVRSFTSFARFIKV